MNITKLKKSTWYRCYPFDTSVYWYIKTTKNRDARRINEWVNNRGEYVNDSYFGNFGDYSDFKGGYHEAALEEINKYLPKNKRIMKFINFIPGKWYKFGECEDKVAAKFESLTNCGCYFNFKEAIRVTEGYFEFKGNWEVPKEVIELSEWDLRKYLPQKNNYEIY